ncbi:MAG: UPF0175 family protein [Cytophagales bacterium]|nr:UPF0175 family protein [Cytophagales bacterium]
MQNQEKITIELPASLLSVFSKKHISPSRKVKELTILELYREGEISSGKAADLLGMDRFEFIRYASRLGIPFLDITNDELDSDIKNVKTAGCK